VGARVDDEGEEGEVAAAGAAPLLLRPPAAADVVGVADAARMAVFVCVLRF